MKKLISILFITVVVFIGCSPNEDVIQPNDPESMFSKILQNKSLQPMLNPSTASKGNNGNGIIFTLDGEFWAIGFYTGTPGVYAFVYASGFGDVKIFPQENRIEYTLRSNNTTAEVVDFRGDVPVLIYSNLCIDKKGVASIRVNTEYWTVLTPEGDVVYWWDGLHTYTSTTASLNAKINDAFVDGECIEPLENKRIKIRLTFTGNSNSENSANFEIVTIVDDH
jgi:hypothetical protein